MTNIIQVYVDTRITYPCLVGQEGDHMVSARKNTLERVYTCTSVSKIQIQNFPHDVLNAMDRSTLCFNIKFKHQEFPEEGDFTTFLISLTDIFNNERITLSRLLLFKEKNDWSSLSYHTTYTFSGTQHISPFFKLFCEDFFVKCQNCFFVYPKRINTSAMETLFSQFKHISGGKQSTTNYATAKAAF